MIIAIANEKGGSSKSTLTSALAIEASLRGYRTLVVDADPQGTLTDWSAVGTEESVAAITVTPTLMIGNQCTISLRGYCSAISSGGPGRPIFL